MARGAQLIKCGSVASAVDYQFERSAGGTVELTLTVAVPQVLVGDLFTGLGQGSTRSVRARARDAFGAGPWSDFLLVTFGRDSDDLGVGVLTIV